ncbi:MAG: hypothetical protein ACO2PM_16140 [Pyrobaculum sp.]
MDTRRSITKTKTNYATRRHAADDPRRGDSRAHLPETSGRGTASG